LQQAGEGDSVAAEHAAAEMATAQQRFALPAYRSHCTRSVLKEQRARYGAHLRTRQPTAIVDVHGAPAAFVINAKNASAAPPSAWGTQRRQPMAAESYARVRHGSEYRA